MWFMVKVKLLMPFRNQPAQSVTHMEYELALTYAQAGVVEILEDPVEAADEIVGNVEKIVYEPPAVEPIPEPEPEPEMTIEDDGTVSGYTAAPLDEDDDAEASQFLSDDDNY
jgi:hypothetical protein